MTRIALALCLVCWGIEASPAHAAGETLSLPAPNGALLDARVASRGVGLPILALSALLPARAGDRSPTPPPTPLIALRLAPDTQTIAAELGVQLRPWNAGMWGVRVVVASGPLLALLDGPGLGARASSLVVGEIRVHDLCMSAGSRIDAGFVIDREVSTRLATVLVFGLGYVPPGGIGVSGTLQGGLAWGAALPPSVVGEASVGLSWPL